MENLAILITIVSITCLILGLIKPNLFQSIFKHNANRRFLSIFFGILTLISFVVFGINSDEKTENKNSKKAEVNKEENSSPSTSLRVEDRIKELIKKELDGNNNSDKPYLRDINLAMDNNEASLIINYNSDENVTTNLTKVGIKSKMSDLYYKLYKSRYPIKSASICAYLSLVDKYGNKSDDIVYTTFLSNVEASKINWTIDENEIKTIIIPQVWTTNFIHPALTKD